MNEASNYKGDHLNNTLIIVHSYHHNNTLKVADAFARILSSKVIAPDHVLIEELVAYDLIGFGAGIDSGRHYRPILDLVDRLPQVNGKQAFIFSTSAIQGKTKEIGRAHV